MASIKQAQSSLGSNFDIGGIARQAPPELNNVERVMLEYSDKFIDLAIKRIRQRKKVDTGNLENIIRTAVVQQGTKYSLTIGYDKSNPASEYYDFQNKGVKGIKSKQPSSSPYQYRTLSVSSKMVNALMQWYLRHKNYIKNEDQKVGLTKIQKKKKNIGQLANSTQNLKRLAINTAKQIKKRGQKRIGFFDDNFDKAFGDDFKSKLAKALGQDIILNIRQNFGNGNNGK
jgi:hypothetical protein